MEVPIWFLAVAGTVMTCVIGVLGYLLRDAHATMRKEISSLKELLEKQSTAMMDTTLAIAAMKSDLERRLVEERLAHTQQFVDKESSTRDYVTMTNRIDGLHKRVDRLERNSNHD